MTANGDPISFISIDFTGTIMPGLLKSLDSNFDYSSFGCTQPHMSLVICATILAAIRRQLHISTSTGHFQL